MAVRQGRAKERPVGRNKAPVRNADSMRTVLRAAGTWALLFCASLAAYLPALHGDLLWDDNMHVTRADLRSLHGLWRIWFDLGATQQYYPLLHSAFWLEHRFWGDATLYYHLINVALHAASACLVVMIVRRLSLPGAWLAGFVFALHPVSVEAVAWISEQKSALSGVLYLAAALTYLHFDRTRRKSQYFLALGLFVLALMSKTVTATLPAVLLVVFWWQRGRLAWKRDVLPLLPWFAAGASAGLFTAWVERTPRLIGAQGPEYALTLIDRLLLAGRVPWFYASKVLWPSNLMFVYPRWKIDSGAWVQYLFPLGMAAVALAFGLLARKNRGPLAAFLIFTGTLFPALGFFNVYPFRYSYVADHFQYLAALAIIVPVASGLTVLARRIGVRRWGTWGALALSALLATTLGAATWRQSGAYRDYETLFRVTMARNPGSALVHNNLGTMLMLKPDGIPEALAEFEEAVRLKPDSPELRVNLGLALAQMPGRLPDAIAEYQTALRADPNFYAAHLNLGLALMSIPGRTRDAVAEYQASLRIDPGVPEVHYELAYALAQIPGRVPEAIIECQKMLLLKPDDEPGRQLLTSLLAFQNPK
ncbi:MAG: tetratricopeptide repeat protein [Acidobacteriia bacterium]|nr:tetratricopeptide repeat protein [Terriglobia bacterium]